MHKNAIALSLLVLAASAQAVDAPRYRAVIVTETGDPHTINDRGQSLWEEVQEGRLIGSVYDGATRTNIIAGIGDTRAASMNNRGQVVGSYGLDYDSYQAFLYSDGQIKELGTLGGGQSLATHVNDSGLIAGTSRTASGASHAFYYSEQTGMVDLGTLGGQNSNVSDVDAAGRILGYSQVATGEWRNFVYENGKMTMLVNANGWLVREFNPNGGYMGVFYPDEFGPPTTFLADDRGQVSTPYDLDSIEDIDSRGYAIGWNEHSDGVLAAPYGPQWTLGELTGDPGWTYMFVVRDVNSSGQIIGMGCRGATGCYGVRLDPVSAVPEPGTYAMLFLGLTIVGSIVSRGKATRAGWPA
jgi:probable HAF family extracellular repeat protein